jgi:dTDP-4-amino-4,6-dideoxygalactose transaminase
MHVKMFDIARDHAAIEKDLLAAVAKVLSTGESILGEAVASFEEAFAKYAGARYAVGVGSGTDAIKIAGLALGLKAGDKVVTAPNSYIATLMPLTVHGIVPVFCDIDPNTYTMDVDQLAHILEGDKGIRVCIPVHLYGHPTRMDRIMDLCTRHEVDVLEDACQAHGALFDGKKVGTFGQASVFSFYPTKNLGCYGDGGMIVTDSPAIREQALMLRNHGQKSRHVHVIEGFNSRLDEVQAAFLKVKLAGLDKANEKRRIIAGWYREGLKGTPLVLPKEEPWAHHVYHLFVVRTKERARLMPFLAERGVSTLIHYPTPIHLQEVYQPLGCGKGSFPEAERAADEILSIPIYPSLSRDEVSHVCESIRAFYGS